MPPTPPSIRIALALLPLLLALPAPAAAAPRAVLLEKFGYRG